MKRLIAMFLSTVLIMMMSAFAFAADYEVVIEEPDTDFELEDWDDMFFVAGYVQANSKDILNWIKITIEGDDDGESFSKTFMIDDSDFDYDGDDYDFRFEIEHPELWGIDEEDDYEITVEAEIKKDGTTNTVKPIADTVVEITFDKTMEYGAQLTKPLEDVIVTDWDDPIEISGWVKAFEEDRLQSVIVEVKGIGHYYYEKFDDFYEYDSDVFEFGNYEFELDDWILDDELNGERFKITLTAIIVPEDDDEDPFTLQNSVVIDVNSEETDNDDDDDDDDDKVMDNYPAAPAVANKILKEMGISNRYRGTNLISEIARLMGPNTEFDGVSKMDVIDYEDAIRDYLVDRIEDLKDLETPPAPGNSANKGNGKVKDK